MEKMMMNLAILFSLTIFVGATSFAQSNDEELTETTINQEVDQELTKIGQNPNLKSQSTSTVKKMTKTSKVQTTPVVVSSSAPVTAAPVAASTQSKKTVVTTKTLNELPVKVPVKSTTVTTTTTSVPKMATTTTTTSVPKAKSTIRKSTVTTTTSAAPMMASPGLGGAQKQPVTFVEASPLTESNADQIRRRRQDEEMRTESKIVEKLEQSRIDDERRRAEALFGDRLEAKPAPVVIEQESAEEKAVAQEVEASAPLMLNETTTSETTITEQKTLGFFDSKYVGLTAGLPGYPDYSNIKGDYNVGIKFGMGHDRFLFEMGLSMAQFTIEDSYYNYGPYAVSSAYNYIYSFANNGQGNINRADFDMKQYSGSLGGRYHILDGFVRPNVGGEFVYSYRQYSSLENTWTANSLGVPTQLPSGTNYGDSHALDFGVLAGVDLAVSESFLIGADFKYLINVAHRINGDNSTSGTPIEKLQHFVGGLSAVFKF